MKDKLLIISLLFLFVAAFSATSAAAFSARTVGLGDEFVAITGTDAIYGNPAAVNVAPHKFTFEFSGGGQAWNNLLMNDYISDSDKDDILDGDDLLGGFNGNQGLKVLVGPVTLIAEGRESAIISLPPDAAELLLDGNEIGETYDFAGTKGSGAAYADAGLNFSTEAAKGVAEDWGVKKVYMGFSYHQLAGVIYQLEGSGETTIEYDDVNNEPDARGNGEFELKYNEDDNATGSALDLGLYAQLNDTYSVGLSVLNLGSMEVKGYHYQKYVYDTEEDLDEDEEGDRDGTLKWDLPTTIRLGGKMNYSEHVDFYADYSNVSYNGGQMEHKVAAATEYTRLNWLPLRTGISYSTLAKEFKWSAGLGLYLGPVKTDLGVSNLLGMFNQAKGGKFSLTTKIEF
ncbi:DUF5723 family protein [Halanaerobacter jeridensis]|uniref:DUF5723 domain-containing protein n=1 Tax=Halanaerobacter jeridensis TaxID=706427 RepID=A0A939BMU7_9FIRM|nr:DUF5723 family protein [Halanaerobacter jeridensis]MBM7557540.1 hypothetical protein [Halanaerobacter jeridensis]